jgi:4'-phosphopantetheinyl transferase
MLANLKKSMKNKYAKTHPYYFQNSMHISDDEIHVWHVSLNQPSFQIEKMSDILSEEEWKRITEYRFNQFRIRYILCRGFLRTILGRYVGINPKVIHFEYGDYGKPVIRGVGGEHRVQFNLAHSGDLAVYAITAKSRIGVDVEYVETFPEMASVATNIFSLREQKAWMALPEEMKKFAFYNGWTRKEAYLKGIGIGLQTELNQIEVSIIPGEPAKLIQQTDEPDEAHSWSLADIVIDKNYVAAVAYDCGFKRIQVRHWDDSSSVKSLGWSHSSEISIRSKVL